MKKPSKKVLNRLVVKNAVKNLIAAGQGLSYALGDEMEGCDSEGCSEASPCSYCRKAQEAIQRFHTVVKQAEKVIE